MNRLVTIKYCLAQVRNMLQLDNSKDMFLLQLIYDCISEINMFHIDLTGPKAVYLDIDSNNTAKLPTDFIDYFRIGRIVNNRISDLTINNNIPLPLATQCGLVTNPTKRVTSTLPIFQDFGVGAGYDIMYYRIDKANGLIIVQGTIPGNQIYLEYISDGVVMSDEQSIPKEAVPAIKAYCAWKSIEYDPRIPLNDKDRKGNLYAAELRRLGSLRMPTMEEMTMAIIEGFKPTIKR